MFSENVEAWDGPTILALIDGVLDGLDPNRLCLRGIRITPTGLDKTGLERDRSNAATYKGVVIVEAAIDFDTMEFAFQPAQISN